jgi:uncharacterized protein YbjT (DUF2867 family)
MEKIAIVIGATGVVGRALVDSLVNASHICKIISITRRASKHMSSKVVNHVVDFDNLTDYSELFKADLLFSCLGTTAKQAGTLAKQRKVDVDYQYEAALLAASNGVEHFLLVSSSGANEKSNNAYLSMKGELEHRVTLLPFKRISIFQPSLLLGQRDDFRLGEKIARWIMPLICLIPALKKFQPITGEQVAAKMVEVSQMAGKPLVFYRLDEIFIKV